MKKKKKYIYIYIIKISQILLLLKFLWNHSTLESSMNY